MQWIILAILFPALILQAILLWRHTVELKRMTTALDAYTAALNRTWTAEAQRIEAHLGTGDQP